MQFLEQQEISARCVTAAIGVHRCLVALTLALSLGGCAVTPVRTRADVSDALRDRTGHGASVSPRRDPGDMPGDVDPGDGLSQTEAVALALWNNPGFQADLARLGVARAELIQAGLLRNPVLSLLFPVGPKQLEANVTWPLEFLWQRRRRVALAQIDLERVAEGLVQNGLNLALEVKLAYADLRLAPARARLSHEIAGLRGEVERLGAVQLAAGEISELELHETRFLNLDAALVARTAHHEIAISRARLLALLGVEPEDIDLDTIDPPATATVLPTVERLVADALAARPDLRAAELAIEAAGKQAGLARSDYLALSATVDANAEGKDGFEIGPGLGVTLPLFDRGQGARARAAAELERSLHAYADVRNRIALGVREAHSRFVAAAQALETVRDGFVPLRRATFEKVQEAFETGEVSRLDVRLSRLEYLRAQLRQAELEAELSRARATLENATGVDLDRSLRQIARSP